MKRKNLGINTICTHVGEVKDTQFQGAISPLFMSSSYQYDGVEVKRYPRYFNTPNQRGLAIKIAALIPYSQAFENILPSLILGKDNSCFLLRQIYPI